MYFCFFFVPTKPEAPLSSPPNAWDAARKNGEQNRTIAQRKLTIDMVSQITFSPQTA